MLQIHNINFYTWVRPPFKTFYYHNVEYHNDQHESHDQGNDQKTITDVFPTGNNLRPLSRLQFSPVSYKDKNIKKVLLWMDQYWDWALNGSGFPQNLSTLHFHLTRNKNAPRKNFYLPKMHLPGSKTLSSHGNLAPLLLLCHASPSSCKTATTKKPTLSSQS